MTASYLSQSPHDRFKKARLQILHSASTWAPERTRGVDDFISHSNPTVSADLHDTLTRKGLLVHVYTYHATSHQWFRFANMAVIDSM